MSTELPPLPTAHSPATPGSYSLNAASLADPGQMYPALYSADQMHAYARAALAAAPVDEPALRAAAQAVVDRWDTPLWKDAPFTGDFINRLRAALAAEDSKGSSRG